ncbi:sek-3 [Capsaspora owczarzaki ATCC 30864]|nr:sek-3 [Capsaspora owczarzaki ATCC 30864]|eukprot:XP_004343669.2 sek-3 [Capsaspora owczarzaki ATCC 30864]
MSTVVLSQASCYATKFSISAARNVSSVSAYGDAGSGIGTRLWKAALFNSAFTQFFDIQINAGTGAGLRIFDVSPMVTLQPDTYYLRVHKFAGPNGNWLLSSTNVAPDATTVQMACTATTILDATSYPNNDLIAYVNFTSWDDSDGDGVMDCNDGCPYNAALLSPVQRYRDLDLDGFGNPSNLVDTCTPSAPGYTVDHTDCNDNCSSCHPGATEVCDYLDNDCDGYVDEGVNITYYRDFDGDSHGNFSDKIVACALPAGYATSSDDCNDNCFTCHPGATEVCDYLDNNCNNQIDEGLTVVYFRGKSRRFYADNDSYGDASTPSSPLCEAPPGYVVSNTDCNDSCSSCYPGAPEVCDELDNNCDTHIDENVQIEVFQDSDLDGFGDVNYPFMTCAVSVGFSLLSTDCNDTDASVHPNATEVCNWIDDNCSGAVDEGLPLHKFRSIALNQTSGTYDFKDDCRAGPGFMAVETPEDSSDSSAVTIGVITGIAGLAVVLFIIILVLRRRKTVGPQGGLAYAWMGDPGSLTRSKAAEMMDPESQALLASFQGALQIHRDWLDLKETIGQGEFGKVYIAFLDRTIDPLALPTDKPAAALSTAVAVAPSGTKVAVKMLHSDASQRERNDFLKEASIMKDFDHENVIRLIGAVTADPTKLMIVLEFAHQGDLKKYIKMSELSEEALAKLPPNQTAPPSSVPLQQMLGFVRDVARGMTYLASRHFVHRDLAARNCMLVESSTGQLVAKVADFGMSRDIYESDYYKKAGVDKVPLRWMAPEALSSRKYSEKTDVWSFGVVCYEVLSVAQLPYGHIATSDLLDYLMAGKRLQRPVGCPVSLYGLMLTCWQFNANNRPRFETISRAMNDIFEHPDVVPSSLSHYLEITPSPGSSTEGELSASSSDTTPLSVAEIIRRGEVTVALKHSGSEDSLSKVGASSHTLIVAGDVSRASAEASVSAATALGSQDTGDYSLTQDAQFSSVEMRHRMESTAAQKRRDGTVTVDVSHENESSVCSTPRQPCGHARVPGQQQRFPLLERSLAKPCNFGGA